MEHSMVHLDQTATASENSAKEVGQIANENGRVTEGSSSMPKPTTAVKTTNAIQSQKKDSIARALKHFRCGQLGHGGQPREPCKRFRHTSGRRTSINTAILNIVHRLTHFADTSIGCQCPSLLLETIQFPP